MKVKDIMSKEIAFVNSNESIESAAQLMQHYNIGSIPVCDNRNLVGIVTDRDITLRAVAKGQYGQSVGDIMTKNPYTTSPETDVHEASRIMGERQIRRLPVIENKSLVGMITLGDISIEPKLADNAEVALKNISVPTTNRFK